MDASAVIVDVLNRVVESQRGILGLVVISLLAFHSLKMILEHAGSWSNHRAQVVMGVVELVITFVTAAIVLKSFLSESIAPHSASAAWHELPFGLLLTLMVFGIVSVLLLWLMQRLK